MDFSLFLMPSIVLIVLEFYPVVLLSPWSMLLVSSAALHAPACGEVYIAARPTLGIGSGSAARGCARSRVRGTDGNEGIRACGVAGSVGNGSARQHACSRPAYVT